uniref:Uncharacterized protein n=1 Tax=Lactuca sativa TaxID=4236 RepID=A0A9R1UWE6_LACSA|nr:hypothetical protein LSAT_V11C800412170 [Lactuca sativa]
MNVANSGQGLVPVPPGVHNPSEVGCRTMVNSQDSYAQPVAVAATHGVVDVYQAYGGAASGQTLPVQVLFKNLNVDLKEVSPSSLLMDKVREVEGSPYFSNKMLVELWLEIIVIYSKKVLECEFKLMTLLHINLINRLYNEMQRIIMRRRLSINVMNAANVPFQHFAD